MAVVEEGGLHGHRVLVRLRRQLHLGVHRPGLAAVEPRVSP